MSKDEKVYNEAEIKDRLKKELPLWVFEGNWIKRKYKKYTYDILIKKFNEIN